MLLERHRGFHNKTVFVTKAKIKVDHNPERVSMELDGTLKESNIKNRH